LQNNIQGYGKIQGGAKVKKSELDAEIAKRLDLSLAAVTSLTGEIFAALVISSMRYPFGNTEFTVPAFGEFNRKVHPSRKVVNKNINSGFAFWTVKRNPVSFRGKTFDINQ
jgi:nucleoid DNA-binding protein